MKKIGKEVLFLETGPKNSRNGEGSFIRLRDGRIMHAYTRYSSDDFDDHAVADIYACYSADEGESWSAPTLLMEKDAAAENIMSTSLLRMENGDLGMIVSRKLLIDENKVICVPYFYRSADEGESWAEGISCGFPDGYYCGHNGNVIRQRNGRILAPKAYHGPYCEGDKIQAGVVKIACSEDDGYSWKELPPEFHSPFEGKVGLEEPGLYEYENGELLLWFRTNYGHQYQCCSKDNGVSWSPIVPNGAFTSPNSPMHIQRVGKYTVAVFNPISYNCLRTDHSVRGSIKRTPLVLAVSTDDGRSFDYSGPNFKVGTLLDFNACCYLLEDDPRNSYCYPSLMEVEDGFLVAYYHSNNSDHSLNCTKITKVYYDELK